MRRTTLISKNIIPKESGTRRNENKETKIAAIIVLIMRSVNPMFFFIVVFFALREVYFKNNFHHPVGL
jgi:hypothetical protein